MCISKLFNFTKFEQINFLQYKCAQLIDVTSGQFLVEIIESRLFL